MKRQKAKLFSLVLVCIMVISTIILPVHALEAPSVFKESSMIAQLREQMDGELDKLSARLIEISDWMYKNPEAAFLEFNASKMLVEELEKNGFIAEWGVPGLEENFDKLKIIGGLTPDYDGPKDLPTAFKAKYNGKLEGPTIGIMVEYDALRGNPPFHGCQHNMQGPVGIGAAIALSKIMEKNNIPGSIWVIGAPAEEVGPPSKAAMANAKYLDGIDFMLMSHGTRAVTQRGSGGFGSMSIRQMKYTFHGKSAHAASAWMGRSALDAVLQVFHSIDMLREHSEPQFRFHGVITDGGIAPNIVPELASTTMWVRHFIDETKNGNVSPRKAGEMIDTKVEQMNNIAKGAALATGTEVEIDQYGIYVPPIAVGSLNDLMFSYAKEYGGINVNEEVGPPSGWDETGLCSVQVPGTTVYIGTEGIPEVVAGHSQENADISITPAGHNSLILTSKVMGAIGLRLLMDADMRNKITEEHAMWVKKYNE